MSTPQKSVQGLNQCRMERQAAIMLELLESLACQQASHVEKMEENQYAVDQFREVSLIRPR
jgi:hypothetical protein